MQFDIFIADSLFAFLLLFCRIGSAIMLMPSVGDSFVPTNIRLLFVLAICFVMTPVLSSNLPSPPNAVLPFALLIISEILVGLFIGTVMRILISSLDTAGMVVSLQSGFANALVFNAIAGGQGSITGALFSILGVVLLLITNLHHLLLSGIFESYNIFPANAQFLDSSSMSKVIVRSVNAAFNIGVKMAAPFIVIGLLLYTGFGILGRLMPQIQIFFLALPVQIWLSLVTLAMVFSASIFMWLSFYESEILKLFGAGY